MTDDLKNMDASERLLVQRQIAAIIDAPSVYMGGPSHQALKKAESIIQRLELGERLFSSTCDHHAWMTFRLHGIFCPDCGSQIKTSEECALGLEREKAEAALPPERT